MQHCTITQNSIEIRDEGAVGPERLLVPRELDDMASALAWVRETVLPRLGETASFDAATPVLRAALAIGLECQSASAVETQTAGGPEPAPRPSDAPGNEALVTTPERAAAPEAAVAVAPLEDLLRAVERSANRHGAVHGETEAAVAQVLAHPRGTAAAAEARLERGLRSASLLRDIYGLAARHGREDARVAAALKAFRREYPYLDRRAEQEADRGGTARQRRQEADRRRAEGMRVSRVRAGSVRHEVAAMTPSPAWQLLIDETGKRFSTEVRDGAEGRFVGLLVPQAVSLPSLPRGFHAVDHDLDAHDRLVQSVVDAPVGVFGVGLSALPPGPGERWVEGVLTVVHWVLRLLPIDGPTRVEVFVEQRGDHKSGADWTALFAEVSRHLAEVDPTRYDRLRLEARVIDKTGHPLNGYVDALAFMWGSPTEASKARLRQSGLRGCLFTGDPRPLRRAFDLLALGTALTGEQWAELVRHQDADEPFSPAGLMLARIGPAAAADVVAWRRHLDATRAHLESKAVRLGLLGRQVQWLVRWQPHGETLPPALRLAFAVARLERANHLGEVDGAVAVELAALGERLFEEEPALVCQADLDRAVLATNRFEFDEASRILAPWASRPPAVPGLRHWARVVSSLGQHAAFRGDFADAERRFAQALSAFARLSDVASAAAEARQTATYRAIVAIDRADLPDTERRRLVEVVVSLAPDDIAALAVSEEPGDKYPHHLLLRYLARHGRPAEIDAYLDARARWRRGIGHPWPLVEGYRALLLAPRDAVAGRPMMEAAAMHALEGGPTVRLIGATLGVIAQSWGSTPVVDDALLDELEAQMPAAAPRVERLRAALGAPVEPLALLSEVLPFNFR
jgi:hypothetical protein